MGKKADEKRWDKRRLFIESLVALLCAILGIVFGKASNTYYYNGQKMSEIELNEIMQENADLNQLRDDLDVTNKELTVQVTQLTSQVDRLTLQVEDKEEENQMMAQENEAIKEQLSQNPMIEYRTVGLSIDGEMQSVNTNKASVLINGVQYYSQDFVSNLLPNDRSVIMRDDILYIGKIVKEKADLLDMPVVDKTSYASIRENMKDTYGNIHTRSVFFKYKNHSITFNAGKEYDKLKCTLAIAQGYKGKGVIQVETEQGVIYTSDELVSTTEPFEVDLSINQASRVTIKYIGDTGEGGMVTDAVLYNEG